MLTINGKKFSNLSGKSVTVYNNKVIIDGKDVSDEFEDSKEINIIIDGNVENLKADDCETITIKGDVETVSTVNGDIDIEGSVEGDVKSINGDVNCGDVYGNVSTKHGDIKYKKH